MMCGLAWRELLACDDKVVSNSGPMCKWGSNNCTKAAVLHCEHDFEHDFEHHVLHHGQQREQNCQYEALVRV